MLGCSIWIPSLSGHTHLGWPRPQFFPSVSNYQTIPLTCAFPSATAMNAHLIRSGLAGLFVVIHAKHWRRLTLNLLLLMPPVRKLPFVPCIKEAFLGLHPDQATICVPCLAVHVMLSPMHSSSGSKHQVYHISHRVCHVLRFVGHCGVKSRVVKAEGKVRSSGCGLYQVLCWVFSLHSAFVFHPQGFSVSPPGFEGVIYAYQFSSPWG